MFQAIPEPLRSLVNLDRLRPFYHVEQIEQLIRHGVQTEGLEVKVALGCDGWWAAIFVHDEVHYFAGGHCDVCPSCEQDDEYQGILFPRTYLMRLLGGAEVVSLPNREEAMAALERVLM